MSNGAAPESLLERALAQRDSAVEDAEFLREYMQSARAYLAHVVDELNRGREFGSLGTRVGAHGPARLSAEIAATRRLRNRLLSALPAEELTRIRPELALVRLRQDEMLFGQDEPMQYVYFLETAVVSLFNRADDGGSVDIGTAGQEGMVGLPIFLAGDRATSNALTLIPGFAWRMDATTFVRLAATGTFQRVLLRYTQAFLLQIAQTAACNATHLLKDRCARWVLMTHDRVAGDEFPLGDALLTLMLGVRRTGATVAMRALQSAGLVDYGKGRVMIIDRLGLEGVACGCYGVVRDHFDRLLPNAG